MTHRTRTAAAVLATVLLLACQSGASPAELLTGPVRVVDGDTLDVYGRAGRVRVRIYGIDTPERGERGYDSATAALRDLVAAGPIECHPRPGEVTYGRIVATCIVAGQDLALALLREPRLVISWSLNSVCWRSSNKKYFLLYFVFFVTVNILFGKQIKVLLLLFLSFGRPDHWLLSLFSLT